MSPVTCSLLCLCFSLGLCAQGRAERRSAPGRAPLAPTQRVQGTEQPSSTEGEEFFIISSVNSNKQQLVLKRPTEVTLLVWVNDKTTYLDQEGRPLQLKDFRAGDTVYVALRSGGKGPPVVARIRKGLMTPQELRRRYLKAGSGDE